MKIIENPRKGSEICADDFGITIGNFDGLHLGHQSLIREVREHCRRQNLKLAVMTFIPHPIEMLTGAKRYLINDYLERRAFLEDLGVDILIEKSFTRDFSTMPPEKFARDFILSLPSLKELFLGHDFVFGANKGGSTEKMKELCHSVGILVTVMTKFEFNKTTVSSSLIRGLLRAGHIEEANCYLGRNYFLSGTVVKGEGRGATLGFPTANISMMDKRLIPARGVYVTRVFYANKVWSSVTNIGVNPTFKRKNLDDIVTVEVHILDFDDIIYGELLKVEFIGRIRDEVKFDDVDALVSQIKKDVSFARDYVTNLDHNAKIPKNAE